MMTRNKAKLIVNAIIGLRDVISDEQAATVAVLYPEWKAEQAYVTGARIAYENTLYKVIQDHVSQVDWTPDTAASLYAKVLTADDGTVLPWEQPDSTNPYMAGDKVTHNGKTWVSNVDNNVWEPGTYGWEEFINN